ncbi:hypothetical protein E2C01_012468 [Portunus trituberculatus]|uniref:Uncharacterized protein n=1 Tax=Portunus trituberculatus TaxID=210409 RepID=A0A5B7DDT8_PORTR|nr:hypothetical protein [Portunus trituberculatus]
MYRYPPPCIPSLPVSFFTFNGMLEARATCEFTDISCSSCLEAVRGAKGAIKKNRSAGRRRRRYVRAVIESRWVKNMDALEIVYGKKGTL